MAERLPDHDFDSDCDEISGGESEPLSKKPKYVGLKYKTKYSKDWESKWPFISSVPHKPHHFRCNLCLKELGCGHQGVSDVKDHILTKSHQKNATEMTTQSKLSFKPKHDLLADKVDAYIMKKRAVSCTLYYRLYVLRLK